MSEVIEVGHSIVIADEYRYTVVTVRAEEIDNDITVHVPRAEDGGTR